MKVKLFVDPHDLRNYLKQNYETMIASTHPESHHLQAEIEISTDEANIEIGAHGRVKVTRK